jgi:hypothetical protein
VNFHCPDEFNHSAVRRYPLRSDPDAVLISPLITDRRSHINFVSDSRAGASVAMASDSRPPGTQDLAESATIVDALHTILAQLSTINKRLELQSETLARHDQILEGQPGSGASTPIPPNPTDKTGQTTVASSASGNGGNNGDGSHHPSRLHHQHNDGDFREELCISFHKPKLNFPHYDRETDPLPWLN